MATLEWNFSPLAEIERMRRDMNELFGRFGTTPGAAAFPPVNVYDKGEEILATVEAPGVPKDKLKVEIRDNVLTISGTRDPAPYRDASALRLEIPTGDFTKLVRLPAKVASDGIEAQYRNGILQIRMPKSEESKPRQIAVEA